MLILFNVRTYVHELNGSVMIRVRWEHKTRTVVFSCGVYADKSKWDCDQQKAQRNTTHIVNSHCYSARDINAAIAERIDVINEAFTQFGEKSHSPTVLELKEFVKLRLEELHPKVKKYTPEYDGVIRIFVSGHNNVSLLSSFYIRPALLGRSAGQFFVFARSGVDGLQAAAPVDFIAQRIDLLLVLQHFVFHKDCCGCKEIIHHGLDGHRRYFGRNRRQCPARRIEIDEGPAAECRREEV